MAVVTDETTTMTNEAVDAESSKAAGDVAPTAADDGNKTDGEAKPEAKPTTDAKEDLVGPSDEDKEADKATAKTKARSKPTDEPKDRVPTLKVGTRAKAVSNAAKENLKSASVKKSEGKANKTTEIKEMSTGERRKHAFR